MQHEITQSGPLLDGFGRLKQRGFAKRPLLEYNPENIRVTPLSLLRRLRIKEWDYYAITSSDCFFSVCVADVGYIGLAFAYLIDFETMNMVDAQLATPLGMGCRLPRTSLDGDIRFRWPGIELQFLRRAEERELQVRWKRFQGDKALNATLKLQQPKPLQGITVATPISQRLFYYNQKVNCMPVDGELELGDRRYSFKPDKSLATLDWGRGVWAYSTFWNWASAAGFLSKSTTIGLNLGSGFGDLSHATENCFFINGEMNKLGWVDIEYDDSNYMLPWKFTDDQGRLDLTFTPFFDRTSKVNLLLLSTRVHQMFGRYSGFVVDDSGKKIKITELVGWAEEHYARW